MKRIIYVMMTVLAVSLLAGTGVSCNKEMFSDSTYRQVVDLLSPVDSVDPRHTWELSTSKYVLVTANAGVGTQKVLLLTDDPMTADDAQVIAVLNMGEGERKGMTVAYPARLSQIFAAAVDGEGRYTISRFGTLESDINFKSPIHRQVKPSYTPDLQYYSFGFEQEFPEPGDYDYNDVLLHVALERVSDLVMKIHVRLAAVGADNQISGCIRLPDLKPSDIDSLYTVGDQSFNKGITKQYMNVIRETKLLLESRYGEAVINLFADAHWATADVLNQDFAVFQRKLYNVTKQSSSDAQLMVPREITYVLKVKDAGKLNALSLDNIDPFIVKQYNGANLEVHTYPYRTVQALFQYNYVDIGHLPWALKVPGGFSFYHPLHGINMGFRMRESGNVGILFGAYSTAGHAFGEWAMNRLQATDWYLYPYTPDVFVW